MTQASNKKLIDYIQSRSENQNTKVFDVIVELKSPAPKDIKKYLDSKAQEKAKKEYEDGLITSNQRKQLVDRETMSMRTILRKLKVLKRRGLIQSEKHRYFISKEIRSDFRYYDTSFGKYALRHIMNFPINKDEANFLNQLVRRFGAFLLYMFIQASKPVKDPTFNAGQRDKLIMSWLRDSIPLDKMYTYFQLPLCARGRDVDYQIMTGKRSSYELDEEKYSSISETFFKLYPNLWSQLTYQTIFDGKPTEPLYSQKLIDDGYFDKYDLTD